MDTDPHEVNNLSNDNSYNEILNELRNELTNHLKDMPDLGFFPESYFLDYGADNPVQFGQRNKDRISNYINIFNVFDSSNPLDIYPLTGKADDPGEYYTQDIGLPADGGFLSSSYYDRPWYYSSPREINFLIQIEYK